MGNNFSNALAEQKELQKIYSIDHRVKDQGLTYLTHKQSKQPYLLRELTYNQEHQFKQALKLIEQRKQFRSNNITNLIRVEQYHQNNLCSKYHRIYSLWQYPKTSLSDEISKRALQKNNFSQSQMRSLVSQIVKGMLTLQKNRISHESITTKSILLQQPFNLKIVDPMTIPLHTNLDTVYHNRSTKNIYLSPQQCNMIENHQLNKIVEEPFKEDVFTTGLVFLETGLLERQNDCYVQDCGAVDWRRIQENLNKFQRQYGYQLRELLSMMLTEKTEDRINWFELDNKLSRGELRQSIRVNAPADISYTQSKQIQQSPKIRTTFIPTRASNEPPSIRIIEPMIRTSFIKQQFRPNVKMMYQQSISQEAQVKQPFIRANTAVNHPHLIRTSHQVSPPLNIQPVNTINVPAQQIIQYVKPVHTTIHKQIPHSIAAPTRVTFSSFKGVNVAESKYSPATVHTSHNQQQLLAFDNQFKINSPTVAQHITKESVGEIKTFELSLDDPIFVIDEFKQGSKYEGYKLKGKRQGWGKFFFQDGGCYEGEWKQNLMSGKGKLYYQSGKLAYDGDWERDQFHGHGKLYNQSPQAKTSKFNYTNFDQIEQYWISYEGQFIQDMKEGKGKLWLSNGQTFEGTFSKDTVEGEGTYLTIEGKKIHGIWHENRFERQLADG